MNTLAAFTSEQKAWAKVLLATTVAKMMGRKFEEDDWAAVYCRTKGIPKGNWSNLHIDVMHEGLGIEHKMLCIGGESPPAQHSRHHTHAPVGNALHPTRQH